jgi:hypothetical protein
MLHSWSMNYSCKRHLGVGLPVVGARIISKVRRSGRYDSTTGLWSGQGHFAAVYLLCAEVGVSLSVT